MLYDNAELLQLYSIAYQLTGKELYARTARGVVDYYKHYGSDESGGFYASRDADIGELEEGGYCTFILEEMLKLYRPFKLVLRDSAEIVCEGNVCKPL